MSESSQCDEEEESLEVCIGSLSEKAVFTFFLLLLRGLCSAELGGILQEEPGGSESSCLAMHGEELGRQGVCSRGPIYNQSQAST